MEQPGGDSQTGGTSPAPSHVLLERVQSPAELCLPRAPSSAEPYSQLVPTLLKAPVPSFPAISSYFSQHEALEPADMPCPSDRLPSAAPSPGKSGCPWEVVLCRFIKHNHVFK